jgi:hypothetical protein
MTFPLVSGKYPCVISYATWNPNDKETDIVLSNGNLTASVPGAEGGQAVVRANKSNSIGKFHWEASVVNYFSSGSSSTYGIGFANAAATLTNWLGSDTNSVGYYANGEYDFNGANYTTGLPNYTTGDVIVVEVDMGMGQVWFAKGSGLWNGIAAANPATNVSGLPLSITTGPFFPAWKTGVGAGGVTPTGETVTANFGASTFVRAPSTGFVGIHT